MSKNAGQNAITSSLMRSYCSLVHCGGKDNGIYLGIYLEYILCIPLEYILKADLDMVLGDKWRKKCSTN